MIYQSGSRPVIVLSKADLVNDPEEVVLGVQLQLPHVEVLSVSTLMELGMERLSDMLSPGKTFVLLGSSGVGKSSLVNYLAKETKMHTRDIRKNDDKGKHTTTPRELFMLPSGAMLIDTPGMRELGMLSSSDGLDQVFSDVEELSLQCKFFNC